MNTEESVKRQLEGNVSQSKPKNLGDASTSSSTIYDIVQEEDKSSLKIWLAIEEKILQLEAENSPRIKARIAKEISTMLAEKLTAIFELFNRYPVIRARYDQYGPITGQLSSYMNANVVALKQSAIEYFRHLYPSADPSKDFTFFNKNEGVQVGQVLRISYVDEEKQHREVSYFIKTHQNGSTSQGGDVTAGIDLKELFVYKALENMHLGPKVHFFTTGLSAQNGFYIATRGFPFSKSANKQKHKFFYTYSRFAEERKLVETTALPSVDSQVVHGLAMIDIISRIFKLSDVATNDGNFGFALRAEKIKVKIIDFRVGMSGDVYTYAEGLLQGFLVGNGAYNYLNFVRTALRDRLSIDKIAEAKAVIESLTQNPKANFDMAVNQAYEEIVQYAIKNKSIWRPEGVLNLALKDLAIYSKAIKENFDTFLREVTERAAKQKLTLG